jgi:formamidopyrimidine-DNA glycosylase
MPELPEVETIASNLRRGGEGVPSLVGCCIQSACTLWPRTLANLTPEELDRRAAGQEVLDIRRRGKFLVFELSRDFLLIHLRMSGDLLVEPAATPPAKHHRLLIQFDNGWRLAFNDTRKFGRVWLTGQLENVLGALGPEPLDENYTLSDFCRDLAKHKRQIKPLLLDQSFLAGLGNIYADESLNLARIHPLQRADRLTKAEARRLLASIRSVLAEGIRRNGASIDWVYRGGDFQNHFRVYQRTGQPCPRCGTPVERIVVGQRGTHFCPQCQALDY